MYLIRVNSSSCLNTINTKRQYYYLITEFPFYVIVNSLIYITVTNLVNICIDHVYNYTSICLKNSTLFLLILSCLLHTKSFAYMEIHTFNINAFSLYLWLGYQILHKRLGYYFKNEKVFNTNSYAAYTLTNKKFHCKNMLRRVLVLLNT